MEKEREISLASLLWRILYGWRMLIVFALVFTALFSAYGFYKYKKAEGSYRESLNLPQKTHDPLDEAQKTEVDTCRVLLERLDAAQAFICDSSFMRIDAFDCPILRISFRFEADADDAAQLSKIYETLLCGDEFLELMKESLGAQENTAYLAECICVKPMRTQLPSDNLLPYILNGDDGSLETEIIYPDAEALESAAETFVEAISALPEYTGIAHTLIYNGYSFSHQADENILSRQNTVINKMNELKSRYTDFSKNFTDEELAALTGITLEDEKDTLSAPAFSKKYPLMGFVIGLFLACTFIALAFVFTGKLSEEEELEKYFGLRLISVISCGDEPTGLDGQLCKLRNRRKKLMNSVQSTSVAVSNLEIICKKEKLESICFTGSEYEKYDRTVIDSLIDSLAEKGIKVTEAGNPCYDMKSLYAVSDSASCVVIEKTGLSCYDEISKEIRTLNGNGVNIICAIALKDMK